MIDLGNAYRVQQALQASADASAAAGAGQLTLTYPPQVATATSQAQKYGSQSGGQNPITGVPAGNVTQTVTVTCAPQAGYNCNSGYANTVTVNETASVPTYSAQAARVQHHQPQRPCAGLFTVRWGAAGRDDRA